MSYFKRNANEAFPPGMHLPQKLLPRKLLPRWPVDTTLSDAEVQLPSGIASELLLVVLAAVLIFMVSVIAINSGRRAWKRLQRSQSHTNCWLDREHDHDQTYNGSMDRNILWASGLTIVVITGIALRSFIMLILDIAVAEQDYRTFCADQKVKPKFCHQPSEQCADRCRSLYRMQHVGLHWQAIQQVRGCMSRPGLSWVH